MFLLNLFDISGRVYHKTFFLQLLVGYCTNYGIFYKWRHLVGWDLKNIV